MAKLYPTTTAELIRNLTPEKVKRTGVIAQIDADSVRVRIGNSVKLIVGCRLVSTTVASVQVGDLVELQIVDNKPVATPIKLNANLTPEVSTGGGTGDMTNSMVLARRGLR